MLSLDLSPAISAAAGLRRGILAKRAQPLTRHWRKHAITPSFAPGPKRIASGRTSHWPTETLATMHALLLERTMSVGKAISALDWQGLLLSEPRGSLACRTKHSKVIAWGPLKPLSHKRFPWSFFCPVCCVCVTTATARS